MKVNSFIIPASKVNALRIRIDEFNIIEPIMMAEGPDKGNYFLDVDILNRVPALDNVLGQGKREPTIVTKEIDTETIKANIPTKSTIEQATK